MAITWALCCCSRPFIWYGSATLYSNMPRSTSVAYIKDNDVWKIISSCVCIWSVICVCIQALAADATVNFSGTILQEACSVDTSDNTVNVQLGTYGAAQFPTVGTTTLPVPFAINLTGCPASGGPTAALVTFSGAADAWWLALTAGGASGVSINIKKQMVPTLILTLPIPVLRWQALRPNNSALPLITSVLRLLSPQARLTPSPV